MWGRQAYLVDLDSVLAVLGHGNTLLPLGMLSVTATWLNNVIMHFGW